MRIASFNVESLFDRAKALDPHDWAAGRQALEDHVRINRLLLRLPVPTAEVPPGSADD